MAEKTIQQALVDCMTEKSKLGQGKNYTVFALQPIGLEPYALRVWSAPSNIQDRLAKLSSTTSLTPPKELARGANIGQPLLHIGDNVQILLRQSGISLADYFKQKEASGLAASRLALMEEIVSAHKRTGINPFVVVGCELRGLANAGYRPDTLNRGNMFWDKDQGKLGLVDQIIERTGGKPDADIAPHIDAFWNQMGGAWMGNNIASLPNPGTAQNIFNACKALYEEARQKAVENKLAPSLSFAAVDSAKIGNTLKLGDAPQQLKAQLDKLRSQALSR